MRLRDRAGREPHHKPVVPPRPIHVMQHGLLALREEWVPVPPCCFLPACPHPAGHQRPWVSTPAPCRWWSAGLRQGQGLSGQQPAAPPGQTPKGRPARTQQHPLPLLEPSSSPALRWTPGLLVTLETFTVEDISCTTRSSCEALVPVLGARLLTTSVRQTQKLLILCKQSSVQYDRQTHRPHPHTPPCPTDRWQWLMLPALSLCPCCQ